MATKNLSVTVLALLLLANIAAAQQQKNGSASKTKPRAAKSDGPSLEKTMTFIQEGLDGLTARFVISYSQHHDWPVDEISIRLTNVLAEPSDCTLSWHRHWHGPNGLHEYGSSDVDYKIYLREVGSVVVRSENDSPDPGWPVGWKVYTPNVNEIDFKPQWGKKLPNISVEVEDQDNANRISRALNHAVQLCGGGAEKLPF